MDYFKTIREDSSAEIEEKKSKFISNIFYIESVKEAEEKIQEIKKMYFDARHNCYAYRILEDGIKTKSSDDGEPSGTAGAPILNIITKKELCNILVVVTRYFGGTLLGTGGLIRAYSDATLKSIEKAGVVTQEEGEELEVILPYKELAPFKYYCSKNGISITNISYENNIKCIIELNNEEKEKIINNQPKSFQMLEYKLLNKKYIRKNIEK